MSTHYHKKYNIINQIITIHFVWFLIFSNTRMSALARLLEEIVIF